MKSSATYFLTFLFTMTSFSFKGNDNKMVILTNLRCEMLMDPLGIDIKAPSLSWEISGNERGIEQTAYQVIVASSINKLNKNEGDLWNSGKVESNESIQIGYSGVLLKSRAECYWKVKVWTNKGESNWSKPAHWTMGLLDWEDWKAKWIGLDRAFPWDSVSKMARLSARYFRKDFSVNQAIRKATVYISGLGLYELYINGQKIGDQVLAPSPTDYSKSVRYNTFDVTNNLQKGFNAIGTVLGNGRFFTMRQNYKPQKWHNFGFPRMLFQLEIEYTDGTKQTIVSDDKWKVTADGPIRTNNEYDGEEYNATKEMQGWNRAAFDDKQWFQAELVQAPGGVVKAQMNENMRVMERIKPVSVKELKKGSFIIDMGQNMAGWIRMKVNGNRGTRVVLKYAESLKPDGGLYTANLRDAQVTDVYTLKGSGVETWRPSFVYHGFRYIEVTNYPGIPTIEDFTGEVIYDNMQTTGSFETSDTTLNQIYRNAYWGIRSNYKGMPVDCPQRNERQPWLGDRTTGAYGESFVFDNARLYAKWLDDIEEAQTPDGSIPDVAPNFWYYYKDDVTWPATYFTIADMLLTQYGYVKPVISHYSSMKKWLSYMQGRYMKDFILTKDSYGDWCVPPESPELIHSKDSTRITAPELLATANYYHLLQLMKKFAHLAGKDEDINAYSTLAIKIKEAFNTRFFNQNQKLYSNNTVTANLLPLAFDMVPEGEQEPVFKHIADKIVEENKGHISTGVIGTQWLMRMLTRYGCPDIAYKIASNRDYPSWGYMVANGATTIWELWNGNTANPQMNSQNHVMLLGDLIIWMYENIGGIKSDPAQPGFKVMEMKPSFTGLGHAKVSYHSIYGQISSEWKKSGQQLDWNITIPGNTKAIIHLPAIVPSDVMENGNEATSAEGVKFLRMEGANAVFEVGSGKYSFRTKTTLKNT